MCIPVSSSEVSPGKVSGVGASHLVLPAPAYRLIAPVDRLCTNMKHFLHLVNKSRLFVCGGKGKQIMAMFSLGRRPFFGGLLTREKGGGMWRGCQVVIFGYTGWRGGGGQGLTCGSLSATGQLLAILHQNSYRNMLAEGGGGVGMARGTWIFLYSIYPYILPQWSLPQSRLSTRLYLQSSELGSPHPSPQASVSLPLWIRGGGHTRLLERGWGAPIRMYFLVTANLPLSPGYKAHMSAWILRAGPPF